MNIEGPDRDFSSKACDKTAVDLFDKEALAKLDKLILGIEKNGESAGIVISSNWRRDRSISQLKELFQQHSFSKKIIDKTSDNNEGPLKYKGVQIQAWLEENRKKFNVSNFVILDDSDEGISELFKNNFVECDGGIFNQEHLENSFEIINSKPFSEIKETMPETSKRTWEDKKSNFNQTFFENKSPLPRKAPDEKRKFNRCNLL